MCVENDIHVLNGRHGLDKEGNFTFINNNGCSCIDYMVCSTSLFKLVTDFYVKDFGVSAHLPLVCQIECYKKTE